MTAKQLAVVITTFLLCLLGSIYIIGDSLGWFNSRIISNIPIAELSESSSSEFGEEVMMGYWVNDVNSGTAWVSANSFEGIDENLYYKFVDESLVSGFFIKPGFQRNDETFEDNGVPTTIEVVYLNHKESGSFFVNIKPKKEELKIKFKQPVKALEMQLVVKNVRPGKKNKNVAISSITFF